MPAKSKSIPDPASTPGSLEEVGYRLFVPQTAARTFVASVHWDSSQANFEIEIPSQKAFWIFLVFSIPSTPSSVRGQYRLPLRRGNPHPSAVWRSRRGSTSPRTLTYSPRNFSAR